MSKRKPAPDLLGDLLSESSSRPVTPQPKTPKTEAVARQPVPEPVPAPTIRTPAPPTPTRPTADAPKVKMTLLLPPDVADRLARFEMEMRFETGERGHALSKSAIIAKSLEILLNEYDAQRMQSRIAFEMRP